MQERTKCKGGKCGRGSIGTRLQGWKNAIQASMDSQKCYEQDVPLKSTLILKRSQQLLRWATAVGRTVGVAAVPFP